jgi:hypothetical protein
MAQDFLPYDIYPGQDLDATKVQKNFEAIEAKFPLRGQDVAEIFGNVINYAGVTIPTEAINVDELFNAATGIARALGCLDIINGMRTMWDSPTTFRVDVGQLLHRAEFKTLELGAGDESCRGPASCFGDPITPGDVLIPGECEPSEGNPSGLDFGDGTLWYFVYAKMDVAGKAPEIRVSIKPPVWCPAKGPEHPTNNKLRYIGPLKTVAAGELKPWIPYSNGWTLWLEDWIRFGTERPSTGSWALLGQNEPANRRVDIPPTADAVRVAALNTYDTDDARLQLRPTQNGAFPDHEGYVISGQTDRFLADTACGIFTGCELAIAPGDGGASLHACYCTHMTRENNDADIVTDLPVNMCHLDSAQMQTIQYKRPSGGGGRNWRYIDVTAFHEPWMR